MTLRIARPAERDPAICRKAFLPERGVSPRRYGIAPAQRRAEELFMLDLIFILVTVGFFALAVGYTRGCERL